jgi:hypothetical protein
VIAFLKSNKSFYVLVGLALLLRIFTEISFPVLTSDNGIQLEAAKNYSITGKFSQSFVTAENLSQIQYTPMNSWPVGSSFIYVLLNWFTNNLIYSEIIFQCIGIILFLTASIKLLKYLNIQPY